MKPYALVALVVALAIAAGLGLAFLLRPLSGSEPGTFSVVCSPVGATGPDCRLVVHVGDRCYGGRKVATIDGATMYAFDGKLSRCAR